MRKMHEEATTADPQLTIIGKYGRYANRWFAVSLILYGASFVLQYWVEDMPQAVMISLFCLWILRIVSMTMVCSKCLALKIALFRQQEKQRNSATGNSVIFRDSYSSAPDIAKAVGVGYASSGVIVQKAASGSSLGSSKEVTFQAATASVASGSINNGSGEMIHSASANDIRHGSLTGVTPMARQRSMGHAIVSRPGSFIDGGKAGLEQLRKASIAPRPKSDYILEGISFPPLLDGKTPSQPNL
ncbi:UNVERIFIED_CONTAM: hypothetical protein HDU68_012756 [Siphonaria sp. JEL0065]|nr:hypothetical protein HDU68_012756 [Siphonaria sp. JEL0065]